MRSSRAALLGVAFVAALKDDNDSAALFFLEQLPLDLRLKMSAVSKRWLWLSHVPDLWRDLSFAYTEHLMEWRGAEPLVDGPDGEELEGYATKVVEGFLKRCGPDLRSLDALALSGRTDMMRVGAGVAWLSPQASVPVLTLLKQSGAGPCITNLRLPAIDWSAFDDPAAAAEDADADEEAGLPRPSELLARAFPLLSNLTISEPYYVHPKNVKGMVERLKCLPPFATTTLLITTNQVRNDNAADYMQSVCTALVFSMTEVVLRFRVAGQLCNNSLRATQCNLSGGLTFVVALVSQTSFVRWPANVALK